MIKKDRLIAGLKELVYVEEGMVTTLANFTKAMVSHVDGIEEGKQKDIEKLLSVLYRDSSKHNEMVRKMIEQVERGEKNEY